MKILRKGFTLVEMLIVIVIIGILAAALIPRLTGAQAQARDTARYADLNQLGTALAVYQGNNGSYPLPNQWIWQVGYELTQLVSEGYIKTLPKDPKLDNTTTFCGVPSSQSDGYSDTLVAGFSNTQYPGEYGYITIEGDNHFVLSANTETLKKGNRIPETDFGTNNTGCIRDTSNYGAGNDATLAQINANMVKGSTVAASVVDTIYIYAN